VFKGSPAHVSALSGPATRAAIRPVIPGGRREGPTMSPRFPAAFRLPAFACWASCPAEEFRSPHGRPTRQPAPGPRRDFHVPHIRVATGLGALFTPRPSGAHTTGPIPPVAARPLSQGPGPIAPVLIPSPELSITRRHQGFTHVHRRVGLPHYCGSPPSEPCVRRQPHTAQASPLGVLADGSSGLLTAAACRRWQ